MENVLYHTGKGFEVESYAGMHVAKATSISSIGLCCGIKTSIEIQYSDIGICHIVVKIHIDKVLADVWIKHFDYWVSGNEAKRYATECLDSLRAEFNAITINF